MNCTLIIPSGGKGLRFGGEIPKQYLDLNGIPIIIRTILKFKDLDFINRVIIALDSEWIEFILNELKKNNFFKEVIFVKSGSTRAESIKNCIIKANEYETNYLFVHDAVRCLVSKNLILNLYNELKKFEIVIPAIKSTDTLKEIKDNFVKRTLNRDNVYQIQTPQVIKFDIYNSIINNIDIHDKKYSDDASIFEEFGHKIKVIEGENYNIKITKNIDYEFAKYILSNKISD